MCTSGVSQAMCVLVGYESRTFRRMISIKFNTFGFAEKVPEDNTRFLAEVTTIEPGRDAGS